MKKGILAFLFCFTTMAHAGHERGGGDEVALLFLQQLGIANFWIQAHPDIHKLLGKVSLDTIAHQAKILVVDQKLFVKYLGQKFEVAATNVPKTGTIYINRARWIHIADPHLAEGLAVHEVASLAGLESTGNYPVSSLYVTLWGIDQGHLPGGKPKMPSLVVTSVTGVSAWNNVGVPTIFGSFAGEEPALGSYTPGNNCSVKVMHCQTSPLCACTEQRAFDYLPIHIDLKHSTSGEALVAVNFNGNVSNIIGRRGNAGDYVEFYWREICAANGLATCEGAGGPFTTFSLQVFIDANGDGVMQPEEENLSMVARIINPGQDYDVFGYPNAQGISNFKLSAGIRSLLLENLDSDGGFPTLNYGSYATHIRVFVSDHNLLDAVPGVALSQDLEINDAGDALKSNVIDGLKPKTLYFIRIAPVDEAKSVVQLFPPNAGLPASCTTAPSSSCPFAMTTR